jgi:hypothetical protein
VPSDWILNRKCDTCCGPIGGNGPIRSELYLNNGVSLPVGGSIFGRDLVAGWDITGGARLMLFQPDMTAAWAVDLSGTNFANQAQRKGGHELQFTILAPDAALGGTVRRFNFGENGVPGVTLGGLNRTFVNIGLGRDWWLGGPATCCGCGNCNDGWSWRIGTDIGGRYGTARASFHEIRPETDVIGGMYLGLHSNVEIPCGCCVLMGGLRTEWSYTWSDVLQRKSDLQEINILFTVGVRY